MNAIAANTDPITSHQAAKRITDSGTRALQKDAALKAVETWPGRTSQELAQKIGGGPDTRYMLARRLPDLEHDGKVRKGPARDCHVTGFKAVTWWPIPAQAERMGA